MILTPETLERMLQDRTEKEINLITFENEFLRYRVNFRNSTRFDTFSVNSNISLINTNKLMEKLFELEKEFNQSKEIIFLQTATKLKKTKIEASSDGTKLIMPNEGEIIGTGSVYTYFGNEYNLPVNNAESYEAHKLLLSEIGYCAISTAIFYDMANLIIFGQNTHSESEMYDTLYSHLLKNKVLINKFKNINATRKVKDAYEIMFSFKSMGDTVLMGKQEKHMVN